MASNAKNGNLNRYRYAIYLIPPYDIAQRVAEVHRMLQKQFGLSAAGKFQVHATLKGFFKRNDSRIDSLVKILDTVFVTQKPVPIHFSGYHIDDIGFGLDISRAGDNPNRELSDLRTRTVDAVLPFMAADCDFARSDLGQPYKAHITLAFRDVSPANRESVLAYLRQAPLPSKPFMADTFHLLEFSSQDWSGDWAKTLRWRLLHSWRLSRDNETQEVAYEESVGEL